MTGGDTFLPYGRQSIDEDDVAAVCAALRSDWLTGGPAVAEFEEAFAGAVEAPHAVACSSGTAGLHLAMRALDIGPGDAVVVPAITFAATANAARYVGADVVFADVDAATGLMGASEFSDALDRAAARRVRAVMPVHLAGQPADIDAIAAIANGRGISIVEDACHAIGSRYGGSDGSGAVGACRSSAMAVFSTHPVKTIATGEGGVVTTRDGALAARLARLRNHGIAHDPEMFVAPELAFDATGERNPWYYEIHEIGFNYRASDIHCALGTSQLKKLATFIERRRALAARYDSLLAPLAPQIRPIGRRPDTQAAWHLYVALIDFTGLGIARADIMRQLRTAGIGTQVHYIPVPWLPCYANDHDRAALPGAAAYYARALSLPLYPAMRIDDVDRVVDGLARATGLASA